MGLRIVWRRIAEVAAEVSTYTTALVVGCGGAPRDDAEGGPERQAADPGHLGCGGRREMTREAADWPRDDATAAPA